ncbi:MAG: hypothetical protein A2086_14450 [Spirochaetes bacterium GWD1_27_9]|nr:MAG: hypothetical protein A2Z98_04590 [Spirochaetes bacterium GWB1_27_13]OHD20590.1 MAG: hypothetical protein A2Y34_06810 [Spirochaetes bacterium GWC1_27_15]OHD41257.1 MAG: hypothetical protein A2086_14450 [Spirochaetes bacterium GWD1_27_9]
MKKLIFLIIDILLFSFLLNAETTNLVFVYEDKQAFPVILGNGQNIDWDKPGASVECIKLLEKKLDIKITFKRFPWKRCLEIMLKSGEADGAFNASYKKEREDFGVYPKKNGLIDESRKFNRISYCFYKLKESKITWDGKEIKNLSKKIGAPLGYSIVDDLKGMGYTVETSSSTANTLKELFVGILDLVAALETEGDYLIEKSPEFNKSIEKLNPPIVSKNYYLMLSHQFVNKNPQLAEKIWDALAEIRKKNFPNIIKKYYK